MTKRNRDKKDNDCVKSSLARFLEETEDEDLLFMESKENDSKRKNDEEEYDDAMTVQSDVLFNRDALNVARSRTVMRKSKPSSANRGSNQGAAKDRRRRKKTDPEERRLRAPRGSRGKRVKERDSSGKSKNSVDTTGNETSTSSLATLDLEASNSSLEPDSRRKNFRTRKPSSGRSLSSSTRERKGKPRRTEDLGESFNSLGSDCMKKTFRSRRQTSSKSLTLTTSERNRKSRRSRVAADKEKTKGNQPKSLSAGLRDLDKKTRRGRRKSSDGASVASNYTTGTYKTSMTANTTQTSRSSYKPSGLEGGALNAFLGNERVGRSSSFRLSGGASVASTPAELKYMKERKAQQDMILDVAVKEKWRKEKKAEEEKELEKKPASDDDESEKGIAEKLKKAAIKTAKKAKCRAAVSEKEKKKSSKKSKRTGKKAKGKTKVAQDVSDILFSPDDNNDEYDSKSLTDRQMLNFAERLTLDDSRKKTLKKGRRNSIASMGIDSSSEFLVPAMNITDTNSLRSRQDYWDITK